MSMTGQDWADCIGLPASAPPLREAVVELGLDDPREVNELPEHGLTLHFREGRLYCVAFDVLDFPDTLPGGIPLYGPLPPGFESTDMDHGVTLYRREVGGLEVSVLDSFGVRFSVDVAAHGDLDALPTRPMSSLWSSSGGTPAPSTASGIPVGYKTGWFAVRGEDPEALHRALRLEGELEECEPEVALSSQMPFISAEYAGWRLVVGSVADDPDYGFSLARRASEELDTRVCFFWSDRVIDSYAWSIFEEGRTVRIWWIEDGEVRTDEGSTLRDEPARVDEEILRDVAREVSVAPNIPTAPALVVR